MVSESSEEEEVTFLTLVGAVKKAAELKHFSCADQSSPTTVMFWANIVSEALPAARGAEEQAEPDGIALTKQHFPKLLCKVLRENRCYSHLKGFEPIMDRLVTKGCAAAAGGECIKKLMSYELHDLKVLNLDGVGIDDQRKFFTSPLYDDFLHHRLPALIAQAKSSEEGEKRNEFLKCANDLMGNLPTLGEGEGSDVKKALSLFHFSLPLSERVTFAMSDPSLVTFCKGWASPFPFAALSFFLGGPCVLRRLDG
jgi:hypothetical protein